MSQFLHISQAKTTKFQENIEEHVCWKRSKAGQAYQTHQANATVSCATCVRVRVCVFECVCVSEREREKERKREREKEKERESVCV